MVAYHRREADERMAVAEIRTQRIYTIVDQLTTDLARQLAELDDVLLTELGGEVDASRPERRVGTG